jgi:hypothetical protein
MIDRRTFRITGLIFLAMIAATVWRLSLLPDWQHVPVGRQGDHHTINGLILFAGAPASLLIMMVLPFIPRLLMSDPEQISLQSWRRWNGRLIVSYAVIIALLQAFVLARSLGFLSLSAPATARFALIWIGIMVMWIGNAAPKLQWNRQLRFVGKLLFGMGLAFIVGSILLPPETWQPAFLCLSLAAFAAAL